MCLSNVQNRGKPKRWSFPVLQHPKRAYVFVPSDNFTGQAFVKQSENLCSMFSGALKPMTLVEKYDDPDMYPIIISGGTQGLRFTL